MVKVSYNKWKILEGEDLGEEAGLEDVSAATELPQPELLESQFVETEDERFEISSKAVFVSLVVTGSVTLLASLFFTPCSADIDLLQLSYKADLPFSSSTMLSFSLSNKFSTAGGLKCKGVSASSYEGIPFRNPVYVIEGVKYSTTLDCREL
uniref:Uncharacterized protein n=1 Tax=Glossina austeni TaxID=7395 RepID=A0A1A9UW12_GLOAU